MLMSNQLVQETERLAIQTSGRIQERRGERGNTRRMSRSAVLDVLCQYVCYADTVESIPDGHFLCDIVKLYNTVPLLFKYKTQ